MYGDAAFILAQNENGETLGRLAVVNNHRYNDFHQSKTAFFYYFETVKDPAVADALFSFPPAFPGTILFPPVFLDR